MNKYSYDPQCEELARYFLSDNRPPLSPEDMNKKAAELAQAIQDAIEMHLSDPEVIS